MPDRDAFAMCPDCDIALQTYGARLACDRCGGVLVGEAELRALLRELDPRRDIAWPASAPATSRRCPCCAAMMTGVRMEGVPVEHCVAHGVWFDRGELAKVLAPDADADAFHREWLARQGSAARFESADLGLWQWLRDRYRRFRQP
jgi:Zn-finger nucleic acid-binding protein